MFTRPCKTVHNCVCMVVCLFTAAGAHCIDTYYCLSSTVASPTVHCRWSDFPCCCWSYLEQSHVHNLYVCCQRSLQGLPLSAFLPMTFTTTFVAPTPCQLSFSDTLITHFYLLTDLQWIQNNEHKLVSAGDPTKPGPTKAGPSKRGTTKLGQVDISSWQCRKLRKISPNFAFFGPHYFRGQPPKFWTCIEIQPDTDHVTEFHVFREVIPCLRTGDPKKLCYQQSILGW